MLKTQHQTNYLKTEIAKQQKEQQNMQQSSKSFQPKTRVRQPSEKQVVLG
jgi:hypothetical protein